MLAWLTYGLLKMLALNSSDIIKIFQNILRHVAGDSAVRSCCRADLKPSKATIVRYEILRAVVMNCSVS
jgi:hypothetical protein